MAKTITIDLERSMSYKTYAPRGMNLGACIIAVAVQDYCSADEQIHESARNFLFPPTPEFRERLDWAVSLAEGVNPAWLRDTLDRMRPRWDAKRRRAA